MSDYKALCERLRHQSEEAYLAGYCDDADHLTEARVAIESLQKQLEEARDETLKWKDAFMAADSAAPRR